MNAATRTTRSRGEVVFLTQYFPPERFTAARRARGLADALSEHFGLVVVTSGPSYPSASFYSAATTRAADGQASYPIRRLPPFRRHSRSFATRALREQLVAARMAFRAADRTADVVLASSPSMFLGPAAWVLARSKRALFVWDVRDLTWDYAVESAAEAAAENPSTLGILNAGARLLQQLMRGVARRADLVLAATPGIATGLAAAGVDAHRIVLVPNVAPPAPQPAELPASRPGEAPVVTYAGLIGHAQRLATLLEVAQELPHVQFCVAGDGPQRSVLVERARSLAVSNVTFLGYLDEARLAEVYARSDILFAQVRDTPTLRTTALPSKLLEYMAAEKPIVYAGLGAAAERVERIGCGVAVPPEDAAAIAAAIRQMLGDQTRAAALGRRGRAFVERDTTAREAFAPVADMLGSRMRGRRQVRGRSGVVVLHISDYAAPYRGSFVRQLELLDEVLRRADIGSSILAFPEAARQHDWTGRVTQSGPPIAFVPPAAPQRAWQTIRAIGGLIDSTHCTLVHSHFGGYDAQSVVAARTRLRRRPGVLWHYRTALESELAERSLARQVKDHVRFRLLGSATERVVAVTEALAREATGRGCGDRACAVVAGCDTDTFRPDPEVRARVRRTLGLREDQVLVLHLGWHWQRKGGDILSAAARELEHRRPAELVFASVGAPPGDAQHPVRALPFTERVQELYQAGDIFVSASRSEGFGNGLVESMATELVAATTVVSGQRETFDGAPGCVQMATATGPALVEALEQLLAQRERWPELGAANRRHVVENFSMRTWATRMADLYCDVLDGGPAGAAAP